MRILVLKNKMAVWLALLLVVGQGCSSKDSSKPGPRGGKSDFYTNFSSQFALDNYKVTESGGHTSMKFTWRTFTKPQKNYILFVHAMDKEGKISFQFDHELKNAAGMPTSAWERGEIVEDIFALTPLGGHPPGKYTLRFGLYTLEPREALPVTATLLTRPKDGWGRHSVLLPEIECR